MPLFGTDGVRGIVNEELTPTLAFKIGNALGRVFEGEYILVGRDTRKTGEMLEAAISAGIAAAGKDVLIFGILPTPAIALLSNKMKTVGVIISASHNPPEFNGIKIVKNGFKLPDDEEKRIEKMIDSERLVDFNKVGRIRRFDEAFDIYTREILRMYEDLNLSGLKISLDVANGSAYLTTPYVLEKLGALIEVHSKEPDGLNINQGCGSTNIDFLRKRKRDGWIGIAHDGDADRVILLDETGEEVHGDKIIGIMALSMKKEGRLKNSKVVATILSNLGLEEFLKSHGISLLRTKVGDRYVLEKMIAEGANLGGERSGHVIFLDRSTTGDGLITALEILKFLKKTGQTLQSLHSPIKDYPQVMKNVPVKDKKVVENPRVKKITEKLDGNGYRVVVRPSGTEPVVRVMVEGLEEGEAKKRAEEIAEVVKEVDSQASS